MLDVPRAIYRSASGSNKSEGDNGSSCLHQDNGNLTRNSTRLVSGGDDRLKIDVHSGMNGYGCTPFPRPDQISLSSTTASTISMPAYNAAAAALARLKPDDIGASRRYADAMERD